MKKILMISFVLFVLLISGCTQPPADNGTGTVPVTVTEPTYGTLSLNITDAKIEGLKVLNVTISGIEVHSGDGEWISFSEEEQTFDLMQLQGVSELLGEKQLETGLYTQIRLAVVSADLELEDGTTADVIVPSDKLKIVRNFAITEDAETEMTIDFRPESVKKTNNEYRMTPTLKLMNSAEFQEHIQQRKQERELEQKIEQEPEQEGTEETDDEGSEDPVETQGATGNLAIYLKDLPTDEIETLNITFSKLEAHKTGGKWFTISEEEQTFDLLQLQDVSTLFGENEVEAGKYTMLRLNIVKATLTLKATETPDTNSPDDNSIDSEPEEIEVTIPSNTLRFNHGFYIGDGETTEILIDFLVDKSMIKTGKGDWKLKPVIKILTLKEPEQTQEQEQEENQEQNEGEDQQNQEQEQDQGEDDLCGNSEIDEGENCENCPEDVVCEEGFECVNAECIEITLCGNGLLDDGEVCDTEGNLGCDTNTTCNTDCTACE